METDDKHKENVKKYAFYIQRYVQAGKTECF